MKTARMILTATMLLSLNATSYCMQSQETASTDAPVNNNCDVITAPRKNSGIHHDGTRDGMFGSGLDTLKNMREGKSYYGKPYGFGDNSEANWTKVGKNDIKTLVDAQTFVEAFTAKGWTSQEALAPSQALIEADRQAKIAASKTQFNTINNQIPGIFSALTARFENRKLADEAAATEVNGKIKALLSQINDLRSLEVARKISNKESRLAEDNKPIEELQALNTQITTIKKTHNAIYNDSKITTAPHLKKDANLNAQNLALITNAFNKRNQTTEVATTNNNSK